jgi:hypothetical protein
MLILKMAQHFWLGQRAQMLADLSMDQETPDANPDKLFALWLRYQTTNDRGFHKCVDQLLKLRAQRLKEVIGFERHEEQVSRAREQAETRAAAKSRHAAVESRKQELHRFAISLAEGKLEHQTLPKAAFDHSPAWMESRNQNAE